MFSIKVVLQDEVRRVQVSQDCGNEGSYLKLQETLRNIFPALKTSQFLLTWQDEEGDSISASSDGELFEALQVLAGGEGIPRFTVKVIEETASESNQTDVIHHLVTCDECGVSPIVGARFKCTVRPDFDLCSTCEARQAQPYPMTKITESVFAGGCPRFGGRWGGPGGRGGCHGRGGFRGHHGGRGGAVHRRGPFGFGHFGLGSPFPPPPHEGHHHFGGPHHGRKGGRGGWGWGNPKHCPAFNGGFESDPYFAEATPFFTEPTSESGAEQEPPKGRPDTRRPVMTPWGPADIVHAYLDGKDILSGLMSGLGVTAPTAAASTSAENTSSASAAPATAVPVSASNAEAPTAQPAGRTLAEAIAEARTHGRHHGRHGRRGAGEGSRQPRHQQEEGSQNGVTRDLNDEDEALQRAISESMDVTQQSASVESSGPFSADTASVSSSASEEADGVIVTAPEAVVEVVSEVQTEPEPVAPAGPTHDDLCLFWSRELSVLASMGFVDTHVLVPLLQTHLGTPGAAGSDHGASPTAGHMEGMQRVVAELLSQMGVMF